jgi:hypothetical protein
MAIEFYDVRQYRAARGPMFDEEGDSPRYKLCVVATDLDYLLDFLTRSVSRPDGYYVKYSEEAKDGMYLGRVFMGTEAAVGQLWAEVKDDDKLLASVQDDHFILKHRDKEALAKAIANGE